ncbi:MAG TPA: type II secretion system protein [Sedimentisphaerales bacterium]|nr:type II secretion system protein [Sedimentisphaerales bacterium]
MKNYEHKTGLTLVEMLIVVAIIVILTTLVIGIATRIDDQSKEQLTENTMAMLESALQEYYEYWKSFPDPNQPPYLTHSAALYGQLQSTLSSRKILDKISDSLIKSNPLAVNMLEIYDPWETALDYRYVPSNNFPELISAGPDNNFGTADDISSR